MHASNGSRHGSIPLDQLPQEMQPLPWFAPNDDPETTQQYLKGCLMPLDEEIAPVPPVRSPAEGSSEQEDRSAQEVRTILAHILDGNPEKFVASSVLHKLRMAFSIFFHIDPYLPAMRQMLQERLHALGPFAELLTAEYLANTSDDLKPLHREQRLKLQKNALLSLMAFGCPEAGEQIILPAKCANGSWKMITYTVAHVPLTPSWLGSQYIAYGLVPEQADDLQDQAPAHLLYRGTTPSGWKGFMWNYFANFFPLTSVGSGLFRLGKKRIQTFLNKQKEITQLKTECHGVSLGGSLSLLTAQACPDEVEAYANVPAGTRKPWETKTHVEIVLRGKDPVTRLGQMPTGEDVHCWYEHLPDDPDHPINADGLTGAHRSHTCSLSLNPDVVVYQVNNPDFFKAGANRRRWHHVWHAAWLLAPAFLAIVGALTLVFHAIKAVFTASVWLLRQADVLPQAATPEQRAATVASQEAPDASLQSAFMGCDPTAGSAHVQISRCLHALLLPDPTDDPLRTLNNLLPSQMHVEDTDLYVSLIWTRSDSESIALFQFKRDNALLPQQDFSDDHLVDLLVQHEQLTAGSPWKTLSLEQQKTLKEALTPFFSQVLERGMEKGKQLDQLAATPSQDAASPAPQAPSP